MNLLISHVLSWPRSNIFFFTKLDWCTETYGILSKCKPYLLVLNYTKQDQSSSEKNLNAKQLRIWPRSGTEAYTYLSCCRRLAVGWGGHFHPRPRDKTQMCFLCVCMLHMTVHKRLWQMKGGLWQLGSGSFHISALKGMLINHTKQPHIEVNSI